MRWCIRCIGQRRSEAQQRYLRRDGAVWVPGGDLRELHSFTPASLRNTEQQLNSTLNVEPEECYFVWNFEKERRKTGENHWDGLWKWSERGAILGPSKTPRGLLYVPLGYVSDHLKENTRKKKESRSLIGIHNGFTPSAQRIQADISDCKCNEIIKSQDIWNRNQGVKSHVQISQRRN